MNLLFRKRRQSGLIVLRAMRSGTFGTEGNRGERRHFRCGALRAAGPFPGPSDGGQLKAFVAGFPTSALSGLSCEFPVLKGFLLSAADSRPAFSGVWGNFLTGTNVLQKLNLVTTAWICHIKMQTVLSRIPIGAAAH